MKKSIMILLAAAFSLQCFSSTGHTTVKFQSVAAANDWETLNWVWNADRACNWAREEALRDIKENKCPDAGYRQSTCNSLSLSRWWIIRKFKSPRFDFDQFTGQCEVGVEARL